MSEQGGTAPAGWNPDPTGRHQYRFWDGSQWSDQVSDVGQVTSDPLTPPPGGPMAARTGGPGGSSTGVRTLLLIGAGVVVLVVVGIVLLLNGGDDDGGDSTSTAEGPELGTGDVQATLRWDTGDDMDLHVIDPDGDEIYFGNRTSPSGGTLDVDDIPSCIEEGPHVENVFWPPDGAPNGGYEVFVQNYTDCDDSPTTATLEVRVRGDVVIDEEITLGEDEESDHFSFDV
jgi:hypothetical protein